jgi:hypothetical protein
MHVRDERRDRHAAQLRCERRCEGQDVRDDRLRLELAHERHRHPRERQRRVVRVERVAGRGEDGVLGRRVERHAAGEDVVLPAPPGLQGHVVATCRERPAQRDGGERVARVAERAEQQPH